MSENLAAALGSAYGRYDRVEAAYNGMSLNDRNTFKEVITDKSFSHAQIAKAMRAIGYDVDRKQVQAFREKLERGKATL